MTKTLTSGSMPQQAAGLSAAEILALAEFVTAGAVVPPKQQSTGLGTKAPAMLNSAVDVNANRCADGRPVRVAGSMWNGWGRDLANSRYQPDPGIKAEDVSKLRLKLAFAYPGALAQGQPTISTRASFGPSLNVPTSPPRQTCCQRRRWIVKPD